LRRSNRHHESHSPLWQQHGSRHFTSKYPENFKVHYVLSKPSDDWKYGKGYVTKELVEKEFPAPSEESKALLCGPPGLVNSMKESLVELGWDKPRAVSKLPDQVFAF
jgi:cytochrome-b5 reductase